MADASNMQTSFAGGEWSPYAQGRADDKEYRQALNICFNGYPVEAGAWTRRQGTRFCATTRYGQFAWLRSFWFSAVAPYTMEFTNGFLRFFNGPNLVCTNDPQTVVSISAANPAVVQTAGNHGWTNGNMVLFLFAGSQSYPGAKTLFMRQFVINVVDTTHISLTDPITGAGIDGSTITLPGNVAQVARVLEIGTPFITPAVTDLTKINTVQAQSQVVALCPGVAPQAILQSSAPSTSAFANFSIGNLTLLDGPYLNPNSTGTITPSALTGTINLTGAPANTFVATDVGRSIRLFSEPAAWASGTAYVAGNVVKYTDGNYYQALANSTGATPPQNPTDWALDPTAAIWTWAIITVVTSGTAVTATIQGPNLLYTTAINSFRLGVYSNTTGYPTCGVYHEGRLWLAGAVGNRVDSSTTDTENPGTFNFAPTASDGTVGDGNAISYVFNAQDVNDILWLAPYNSGIVAGTLGGEWMIAASSLNDPLTPTSIQAHRRSRYKCANIQPTMPGMSLLFVQAGLRKCMEYVADVFSGKLLGRNLNEKSKHLTYPGFAQIEYQQELNPIVWARRTDGALVGSTYKRESSFTSEPPTMNGWHRHALGSGRSVEAMAVGPSINGQYDNLTISTNQTNTAASDFGVRHVEILTDMFDENNAVYQAWFMDDALTPSAMTEAANQLTLYGYNHLVGKTVSTWVAGMDGGDATVAADGSITIPVNAANSLLTDANIDAVSNLGVDFGGLGVYLNRTVNVKYPVFANAAVQSYISSVTPSKWLDDYAHQLCYGLAALGGGEIAQFNRLTGAMNWHVTNATLFTAAQTAAGWGINTNQDIVLDPLNQNMFIAVQGANAMNLAKYKITNSGLVFQKNFGTNSSSFTSNNLNCTSMQGGRIINVKGGFSGNAGKNWLIYVGLLNASQAQINVIDADLMQWGGHSSPLLENTGGGGFRGLCLGENLSNGKNIFSGYGAAYTLASDGTHASIYKTEIGSLAGSYSNPPLPPANTVPNNAIATTTLVRLAPATIDATWTAITGAVGPVFDPTDGNIIINVTNTGGATQSYILKINSQTGAIIWSTATASNVNWDTSNSYGPNVSLMTDGNFAWLSSFSVVSHLTTISSAGVLGATTTFGELNNSYTQCVDNDGSIMTIGSWNGSTLIALNGTVAFGTKLMKVYLTPQFTGDITETQSEVIPVVAGFTYTSQGQRLRDLAPDASGARNGPALGKTRRIHRAAAMLAQAQGISFGADGMRADQVRPAKLLSQNGRGTQVIANNVLFTGVWTAPADGDYNYDNMLSWQITRPYPCTVSAAGNMLETQDR